MNVQKYEALSPASAKFLECEDVPFERSMMEQGRRASREVLDSHHVKNDRCRLMARVGCGLALVACVAAAVTVMRSDSQANAETSPEDSVVMYAYTDGYCAGFEGVLDPGHHACCPYSCGDKCGAVDCQDGLGGPTQCCWGKMNPTYLCDDGDVFGGVVVGRQKAPCILPPITSTTTVTTTTVTITSTTTTVAYNVYTGKLRLDSSMPLTILGNSVASRAAIQSGLQSAFLGSQVRVTKLELKPYQGIDVEYILQMPSPAEVEPARFPGEDVTALIEIKEALKANHFKAGSVSKVTLDQPTHTVSAAPAIV